MSDQSLKVWATESKSRRFKNANVVNPLVSALVYFFCSGPKEFRSTERPQAALNIITESLHLHFSLSQPISNIFYSCSSKRLSSMASHAKIFVEHPIKLFQLLHNHWKYFSFRNILQIFVFLQLFIVQVSKDNPWSPCLRALRRPIKHKDFSNVVIFLRF